MIVLLCATELDKCSCSFLPKLDPVLSVNELAKTIFYLNVGNKYKLHNNTETVT